MVRLAVDFENRSQVWWDSGGREFWEGIAESADSPGVVVDESLAVSWLVEASKIPGWNDGSEYAPHPIVQRELDPDEEV